MPWVVMDPVQGFCNGPDIVGVCENATSCAAGNSGQFHAIIDWMSLTGPLSTSAALLPQSWMLLPPTRSTGLRPTS